MPQPDAAQVREHRGALDGEHPIERADRRRMLLRADRRETARPGSVARQGVDAVNLLVHLADPRSECWARAGG